MEGQGSRTQRPGNGNTIVVDENTPTSQPQPNNDWILEL
jgi:hypothetical protein